MYKIPVLLLAYKRTKNIKIILKILKDLDVVKLYVSIDGPKNTKSDILQNKKLKKIFNNLNWKHKIKKNYLNKNHGCRDAVSNAINWFFNNEKMGIILEDDCLPNKSFFNFCKKNLIYFKNNKKIGCITGNNFQKDSLKEYEYYFSKYPHCWGWATWRRSWKNYDRDIKFWRSFRLSQSWKNFFNESTQYRYWTKIFNNCYANKLDSWAFPWTLCLWRKNLLTITPAVNLVMNKGFGSSATHTISKNDNMFYQYYELNKNLKRPKKIKVDNKMDDYVFNYHFKGKNYLWPYRLFYLISFFFKDPYNFIKKIKKKIND
tara:strand:+ start:1100 stop:2050 length:951 start_codon:yes stop_codon:yes gene_type:complete